MDKLEAIEIIRIALMNYINDSSGNDTEETNQIEEAFNMIKGETNIVKLEKYPESTFKNEKVIDITVHEDLAKINTLNHSKTFYFNENVTDYSADYIICMIQDEDEIEVRKY